MASWRSLVFTMQEGDSGLRPSCCQDGILVPFSLMTNPAGLSLIITHKHSHTHTWPLEKGIEGQDDSELFEDEPLPFRENLQCKSVIFFCIDHNIYMLLGVPGNVRKQ